MTDKTDGMFIDYLLTLDNKDFYNLMYNYLGKTEPSANKHEIAQKLIDFLQQDETLQTIKLYLTYEEKAILTTIFMLGKATAQQIHELIPHLSLSYIINKLKNLKERLLIISIEKKNLLNPVLGDFFAKERINQSHFLCAEKNTKPIPLWLDDTLMTLSLSLFIHLPSQTKWQTQWVHTFPQIPLSHAEILYTAYQYLHLITDRCQPILSNLTSFAQLSPLSRAAHILAAYISVDEKNFPSIVETLYHILKTYDSFRCYPGLFERIYFILSNENVPTESIQCFINCDIVEQTNTESITVKHFMPPTQEKSLAIESDQTALLMPHAPFILPLILAFKPVLNDTFAHFHFDRTSFSVALSTGYTLKALLNGLEKYLKTPLKPSLLSNMQTLVDDLQRVKAYYGYFLQLDADAKRRLSYVQSLDDLAKEIVPGLYWLKNTPDNTLEHAFQQAGLKLPLFFSNEEAPLYDFYHLTNEKLPSPQVDFCGPEEPPKLLTELLHMASTTEQKILVKQRVILNKQQLMRPPLQTRIVAHATDFSHKISVIQQAIQDELYLEITLFSREKQTMVIVIPDQVERHSEGAILVGTNYLTGRPVRLHIERLVTIATVMPSLLH